MLCNFSWRKWGHLVNQETFLRVFMLEWFHCNLLVSFPGSHLLGRQGPGNETRTYQWSLNICVVFSGKEWRVQATGGLWDLQPFTGTTWWSNDDLIWCYDDIKYCLMWCFDGVMMTSYWWHQTLHNIIGQGLLDMQPLHAKQIASQSNHFTVVTEWHITESVAQVRTSWAGDL